MPVVPQGVSGASTLGEVMDIIQDGNDQSQVNQGAESKSRSVRATRQERGQNHHVPRHVASIEIIEQPSQYVRFRYPSEHLSPGMTGRNTTASNKTFPTIKIVGYEGPVVVIVSCVTKDFPYRAHPHSLVGEGCKNGFYHQLLTPENMTITFPKLSIHCNRKDKVRESLDLRQQKNVDPYGAGFNHIDRADELDMDAIRLCFQVILKDSRQILHPVVTNPVRNRKLCSSLRICKLSHSSASVAGGQEVMLFCDKIIKDDVEIVFYEENENGMLWEEKAEFQPSDVHKEYGISFRTPAYTVKVNDTVNVFVQLRQPSNNRCGHPLPFQLYPAVDRKRKYNSDINFHLRSIPSTSRQITIEGLIHSPPTPGVNNPTGNLQRIHTAHQSNKDNYNTEVTDGMCTFPGSDLFHMSLSPQLGRNTAPSPFQQSPVPADLLQCTGAAQSPTNPAIDQNAMLGISNTNSPAFCHFEMNYQLDGPDAITDHPIMIAQPLNRNNNLELPNPILVDSGPFDNFDSIDTGTDLTGNVHNLSGLMSEVNINEGQH